MVKENDSDTSSILEAWRSRGTMSSDSERSRTASSRSSSAEITPQAGLNEEIKMLSHEVLKDINADTKYMFTTNRNCATVFSDQGTEVPTAEIESEEGSVHEIEHNNAEAGEESEEDELEEGEGEADDDDDVDDAILEQTNQCAYSIRNNATTSSEYLIALDDVIERADLPTLHPALQHLRDLDDSDVQSPHPRRHLRPPITAAEQASPLPLYEHTAPAHAPSSHPPAFLYGAHPQAGMHPHSHQNYPPHHNSAYPASHSFPYWAYSQPYRTSFGLTSHETENSPDDMSLPNTGAQKSRPMSSNSVRSNSHDEIAAALSKSNSPVVPLYRRFLGLNHRVLLHLQADISELERELHHLDRNLQACSLYDSHDGLIQSHRRASKVERLKDSRTALLGRIFVKLQQYHKALDLHTTGEKAYRTASHNDISRYLVWLSSNSLSNELDRHIFDHANDLISLSNSRISPFPTEIAISMLSRLFILFGSYAFVGTFILLSSFLIGQPWWITSFALFAASTWERITAVR